MFEKLRAAIFGRPTPGFRHGPNDGIVHRDLVRSFAERSAVAQALQKLGLHTMDPKKHKEIVDDHTRIASWLAHEMPGHPLVQHYKRAAEQLNAPDVVKPTPNPTALGEFPEPEKHQFYTVPNVGPAGKDLTDAAIPLVRFVNTLRARARKQPALSDVVPDLPEPPAKPEPPEPEIEPLEFVRYRGGIGVTGDRWKDIAKLSTLNTPRTEIVRHLIKTYAMSPKAAAATYTRWLRHSAKKLARRVWAVKLAREPSTRALLTNKNVDPRIAGTRLAFHLLELIKHYAKTQPRIAELAKRALSGGRTAHNTEIVPPNMVRGTGGDPYAALGDELKRYTDVHGMAVKGWRDPAEPAVRIGTAYNWNKMDKGLAAETYMRKFLRQIVKNKDMSDRDLFEAAERQFDRDPGTKEKYLGHWINTHAAGKGYKVDDLHNAIRRLADREADREELANGPANEHKPRTMDGADEHHWKQAFKWTVANPHAKFSRIASVQQFLPALLREHIRVHSKDLHTTTGSGALADYLEENDDPREELLRRNEPGPLFPAVYRLTDRVDNGNSAFHGMIFHDFGDGTQLTASPVINLRNKRNKRRAWAVTWAHNTGPKLARVAFGDEEFHNWLRKLPPENQAAIEKDSNRPNRPYLKVKLDRKSAWISAKIAKIMKDGIRGRKVDQKQAEAVAYAMWEKHGGKDNG